MKKILALVVAAMLLLSMTAAFAADPTYPGSITIKNSEKDTVYNFYRILDLTGKDNNTDGTYDAITYTVNSTWASFIDDYLVGTNTGSLNQIVVNGAVKYINITDDNIVDVTNAAMEYAIANNITYDETATGTGSDLTVSNLPLGYYLMIPVDASLKTDESSGSVASLTSTIPSTNILVKAKKPSIEKIDDKISADVGQTVTYTVTGKVPNTSGYQTYKYVIKDEMTSGLTFKKDVKIEVVTVPAEGETPATKVDVTNKATIDYSADNSFSADINVFQLQEYVGKDIVLTYTAVVNDAAVASSQEKNKVHLEYGHNPSELEKTTPIEEEVYSAKIIINKYTDNATTGPKLADAKFALMNKEGKFYKYTAASGEEPAKVEWVALTSGPSANESSVVTDAQVAVVAKADSDGDITTVTTNDSGAGEFPGLADGTYYLVEFEAPKGYNRVDKAIPVEVKGTDVDTATGKTENVADATGSYDSSNDAQADVQNKTGTQLPSTGGIGTTIFYVVGGILVLGAVIFLVTKRRMGSND